VTRPITAKPFNGDSFDLPVFGYRAMVHDSAGKDFSSPTLQT